MYNMTCVIVSQQKFYAIKRILEKCLGGFFCSPMHQLSRPRVSERKFDKIHMH